jgi:hypothetical protein
MRVFAWLILLLGGILTVGFLFLFLDLFVTGIFSGNAYRYEGMATALVLLGGSAFIVFAGLRGLRHPNAEQQMTTSGR